MIAALWPVLTRTLPRCLFCAVLLAVVIESSLDEADEFHGASLTAIANSSESRSREYHAYIEELDLSLPGDDEKHSKHASGSYALRDRCRTEFSFQFGNKGFEGAAVVHAALGNETDELVFMGERLKPRIDMQG